MVRDRPASRGKGRVGTGKRASTLPGDNARKPIRPAAAEPPPTHVLIRVRAEEGLTIEAHGGVIAKYGTALFGQFGRPIGPAFRDSLNRQAASGQKTYLFITTRLGWRGEYITYRCPLRQVFDSLDDSKRHLVPSYYVGQAPYIRAWFEIAGIERLGRDEMSRIHVLSSGRSIVNAIFSKAVVFRVVVR